MNMNKRLALTTIERGRIHRRKSSCCQPLLSDQLRIRLKQLDGLKYETNLSPLFLGLLNTYKKVNYGLLHFLN